MSSSSQNTLVWPQKRREVQNFVLDSTRWNEIKFRDGDIVIATYAKAGTTWMQQILGQMIFRGAEGIPVVDICPFVEACFVPKPDMLAMLEAQTHRRFLKTHLPLDALVFSPQVKYIYIGRDGRDTLWSMYHHHQLFTDVAYQMMNDRPDRPGPRFEKPVDDVVRYFHEWLDRDGFPFWPFWEHIQGWWNQRHLPNILFVHFNHLKADLPGEMRRIAQFLDIGVEEQLWPALVEHCTFDYMKRTGDELSAILGIAFQGGGKSFINKGTNGRWRDVLSAEEIAKYERAAQQNLTPDCARWLATGELP